LERHNILGEIKTIQDMENYRNNYFEIWYKNYLLLKL
jgi:hypothetical protein